MYETFYKFSEKPFNTTPDSKFFFPSAKHTEALNNLIYAINERKGFVVITGEIGAGKTTVYRTLLNKLDLNTRVAIITNTHLTCKELITEILEELEVEYRPGTKQKLLSQLNAHLVRQLAQNINVVLIIDEAQNLTSKVLEEVRMLSNLETEKEKLIQIILVGQPQLKIKLENIKLEQFKQRIALYYHLYPLTKEESKQYIAHRIKLVSSNGMDFFTPAALELICEHSRGIPRIINLICDSALLSGYIYDSKTINENIISEVLKERKALGLPTEGGTPIHQIESGGPAENRTSHNSGTPADQIRRGAETPPIGPGGTAEGEALKLFCCSICKDYNKCETKFIRGTKGEEQLCCPKCQSYQHCLENAMAR
jgi:general secretion pathway protein A